MDDEIDDQADQYRLAASEFHLLTGTPPFAPLNPAVLIGSSSTTTAAAKRYPTRFDRARHVFVRALSQDPVDSSAGVGLRSGAGVEWRQAVHVRTTSGLLGASDHQAPPLPPCSPRRRTNGIGSTGPAHSPATVAEVASAAPRRRATAPRVEAVTPRSPNLRPHDDGDCRRPRLGRGARSPEKADCGHRGTILVVVMASFVSVQLAVSLPIRRTPTMSRPRPPSLPSRRRSPLSP